MQWWPIANQQSPFFIQIATRCEGRKLPKSSAIFSQILVLMWKASQGGIQKPRGQDFDHF